MSADWNQMLNLQGMHFLADTNAPTTSWIDKYIPQEDRPIVRASIEQAIKAKKIMELEHRVFKADGTIGWTFSKAVPVLDEYGEIKEWFGAASDVTEHKKAEEALKQSENNLRNIILQAPIAMCIFRGKDYIVEIANDSMLEIWDKTREQVR